MATFSMKIENSGSKFYTKSQTYKHEKIINQNYKQRKSETVFMNKSALRNIPSQSIASKFNNFDGMTETSNLSNFKFQNTLSVSSPQNHLFKTLSSKSYNDYEDKSNFYTKIMEIIWKQINDSIFEILNELESIDIENELLIKVKQNLIYFIKEVSLLKLSLFLLLFFILLSYIL